MKEYIKLMKRFHLGGGILLLLILSSLLDGIQTYETKALQAVLSDISSKENMILFIAVSVTIPILAFIHFRISSYMRSRFVHEYRVQLFEKVVNSPMEKLQEMKIGKVTVSIDSGESMSDDIVEIPEWILGMIVSLVLALFLMLRQNVILTGIIVAEVIPFGLLILSARKKSRVLAKKKRELNGKTYTGIQRLLSFLAIKSFSKEKAEIEAFDNLSSDFHKIMLEKQGVNQFLWTVIRFSSACLNITIVLYGLYMNSKGRLDVPELLLFVMLKGNLISPFESLTRMVDAATATFNHIAENNKIFELEEEYDGSLTLESFEDSIELKNVGFRYDDSDDVLQNVSLKIPKGSKVGIYGHSGCGKSSLVNLLTRFFMVSDGEILVDNININEFTKKSLRKHIGIVNQDIKIFSDMTVKENIAYGLSAATEVEIVRAAKKAHAHEFIIELENGYDSLIGNDGVKLSGGELQRISLARLFLLNPDILILDEATSKLDNESEDLIKDSIEKLSKDKTVISIAHRFTTIEDADILVGIKNHTIYEVGTKESLDVEGTLFHSLHR